MTETKLLLVFPEEKDSLTLLYALNGLKRFYPKKFDVVAITVDLDFVIQDFSKIEKYCNDMDIEYYVVKTEIANVVFNERQESNPCSEKTKILKGALNDFAKSIGCNKIAYAHHKDDMIETMFLSLIYEGRFHCFSPVTYLDKMELTVIRPLMYVPKLTLSVSLTNTSCLWLWQMSCRRSH